MWYQKITQCVLALFSLLGINRSLSHTRRAQTSVPIQRSPDPVVSDEQSDDESEGGETFGTWDSHRADKLYEVESYEQQGLRLLAKSALLRVAIRCDDHGERSLAEELREQASLLDHQNVDALSAEQRWQPTSLRLAPETLSTSA
jgi:hypothetical protein